MVIVGNSVPVLVVVPEPPATEPDTEAVINRLLEIRKGHRLDGVTIRELIDEGRRC